MTEPTQRAADKEARPRFAYVSKRGMAEGIIAPRSQICMSAPRNPR